MTIGDGLQVAQQPLHRPLVQVRDAQDIVETCQEGAGWMFSFDLQDGYHAIGIAPEDRKYFTFNLATEDFCSVRDCLLAGTPLLTFS